MLVYYILSCKNTNFSTDPRETLFLSTICPAFENIRSELKAVAGIFI